MPRWIKLVAAVALLGALYWRCDAGRVAGALAGLNVIYLGLAFLMFIPQTLVSAWRWQFFVSPLCNISLWEAVRQTLAASAWNLAAPSKLGDLTKAAMLPIGAEERRRAWTLVVIEKLVDVAALATLWLLAATWQTGNGWLLLSGVVLAATSTAIATRLPSIHSALRTPHSALFSLFLWFLHLAQIHLMLLAAGVPVGFGTSLARVPAAIFAGLLPLSLCGIGPRDGALIWLFSDVAPASAMAAVGLLTATRYLVPGAAGIFCLGGLRRNSQNTGSPSKTIRIPSANEDRQLAQAPSTCGAS